MMEVLSHLFKQMRYINSGNSGGINTNGNLIGINTSDSIKNRFIWWIWFWRFPQIWLEKIINDLKEYGEVRGNILEFILLI